MDRKNCFAAKIYVMQRKIHEAIVREELYLSVEALQVILKYEKVFLGFGTT